MMFSDVELRKAADIVSEAIGNRYIAMEVPEHMFSDSFIAGINALVEKRRKKAKVISAFQYIAASFALLLFLGGVYIATSPDARADFMRWTRDVWENSIIYRFFSEEKAILPSLRIGWLPDGFELVEETEKASLYNAYYVIAGTEQFIDITYHPYTDEVLEKFGYSDDEYEIEQVEFSGYYGEFYRSLSGEENNMGNTA